MAVPAWSPIPDSDIDPESPITTSLMTRLRDQWAAYIGVDPEAATKPPFTLPPSYMELKRFSTTSIERDWTTHGDGTTTGTEFILATIAASNELITVEPAAGAIINFLGDATIAAQASGSPSAENGMLDLDVAYSAGTPTGVRCYSDGVVVETLPLDNAWHAIIQDTSGGSGSYVEGRARATSTTVYLTFRVRISGGTAGWYCYVGARIRTLQFASKI